MAKLGLAVKGSIVRQYPINNARVYKRGHMPVLTYIIYRLYDPSNASPVTLDLPDYQARQSSAVSKPEP